MADDIVTHCLRTADEMEAEGDSFTIRPSSSFMREVAAEILRLRQEINRLTALRIADSMQPQRHGWRKRRGQ